MLAKDDLRTDLMIWIPVSCGLILTIIASMFGARRGKKDAVYDHSETE
jgi:nucleoside recognition membrane protein YjiH